MYSLLMNAVCPMSAAVIVNPETIVARFPAFAIALTVALSACSAGDAEVGWAGSVDTLATGQVVVMNPAEPLWTDADRWSVVEELRLGTIEDIGPEMFGRVLDFETDPLGRIWIFEGQAQELRVFDSAGAHVRTIGRQGEGPGEFNQVIGMEWGPDGHLWLIDPANNRISKVDTAGIFVESVPTIGGITVMPWPGGFDRSGHFYTYGIDPEMEDDFGLLMIRHDGDLRPLDSLPVPELPGERLFLELQAEDRHLITPVPFAPGIEWRLRSDGGYWAALDSEYRLFELAWPSGDTLRTITRDWEPLPVTEQDLDRALEGMEWFIEMGGKIDRSEIPSTKPAFDSFFVDPFDRVWVVRTTAVPDTENRILDVFDHDGRFLGTVELPFRLADYPDPIVRGDYMIALVEDELEVPYVVRARIVQGLQ
jgi:hypothetical protein